MALREKPLVRGGEPTPMSIPQRSRVDRQRAELGREVEEACSESPSRVTPAFAARILADADPGCAVPGTLGTDAGGLFQHDFSQVRIHAGPIPTELAAVIGARAFTIGNDIFVREPSEQSGSSSQSRRVLTHELAHVAQAEDRNERQPIAAGQPLFKRPEHVIFGDPEGATFVRTPEGHIGEERHGTVPQVDEIRAAMQRAFRGRVASMSTPDLIREAERLDARLWAVEEEVGKREKAAIAETLIAMYGIFAGRLRSAPRDAQGRPVVEGVTWSEGDPLAGIAEALSPFGNLDLWHTFAVAPEVPSRRPRKRKRSVTRYTFEDEEVTVPTRAPDAFSRHRLNDPARRPSEFAEEVETAVHLGGGVLEQIGEEAVGIGALGVAAEVGAMYAQYFLALREAHKLRVEGGNVRGEFVTVLVANDLNERGQLAGMDADDLAARVVTSSTYAQEFKVQQSFEGEGGVMGRWERAEGREEGIRHMAVKIADATRTAREFYRELSEPPIPIASDTQFSFNWRRQAWASRRKAMEKAGWRFQDRDRESRLLQYLVAKSLFEKASVESK